MFKPFGILLFLYVQHILTFSMMPHICLVVMCGLPGSGKSTFVQQLKTECDSMAFITVEYDKLLPADVENTLIALEDQESSLWKKYRSEIVTCIDSLIQILQNTSTHSWTESINMLPETTGVRSDLWAAFKDTIKDELSSDQVERSCDCVAIIIDDNMYYTSMRYPFYQLARKYTISFCEVFVNIDPNLALKRNQCRNVKVKDDVIITMATRMEPPDPDKEHWERLGVVIDSGNKYDRSSVVRLIKQSLSEPVQPIQEVDPELQNQSRVVCSENLVHQSDQILRKIVSEHMEIAKGQQLSKLEMKELASAMQVKRKQILETLKTGDLLVPPSLFVTVTNSSKSCDSELFKFLKDTFEHL